MYILQTVWCLSVRKWRSQNTLGAQGQWQVEVGEPFAAALASLDSDVIKENFSNVGFLPLSSLTTFSHMHF